MIADGEQRSALAVTRSLGRAGYHTIVCAPSESSLAGASRYATAHIVVPNSLRDPTGFANAIAEATQRFSVEVLLPISEASLRAILPSRGMLRPTIVPFASSETFAAVSNKAMVLAAAARHGIAVPQQRILEPRDDLAAAAADLRLPVVVKPARSVADVGSSRLKFGSAHARDEATLHAIITRIPNEAYPVLVQERVVGVGVGVFVLLWDGELRAAFAHRRIREKPPSGGVSVLSESIPLDPELLARSVALLRDFNWQGVAMVEYKIDEGTGIPYLMEINGRFWGSLQLAIDSGVDFPNLLVDAACGEPARPAPEYKVGRRLRWEWGDVDNLVMRLRRSSTALALPQGAPGRLKGIVDFARAFGPGTRGEILRADDPRPFLHETLNWFRRR